MQVEWIETSKRKPKIGQKVVCLYLSRPENVPAYYEEPLIGYYQGGDK